MLALDHAVLFARDLDVAAPAWRRLGFTVAPRGEHSGLGTANHTIMFERTYLELLTVRTPKPANARWAELLNRGNGLGAIAFATRDTRAIRGGLVSRGVPVAPAVSLARQVRSGGRDVEARFTLAHLDPMAGPAIAAFLCQHHTPEHVWQPPFLIHANGATHLSGITIVADRPGDFGPATEHLLGRAAVHPHPGGIDVDLRGTRLWIVTPEFASRRLGRRVGPAPTPHPLGVSVVVRDLGVARRCLASAGVPYAGFGRHSIAVEETFTGGVHLELVAG